ncbi:hypothetical protein [Segatella oulorum]|uniref:hypothetical protein n=1 Tax=Segatella oulorum TaxID=28136 RepID=UPI0005900F94|nr:hypothetical protein [Segatella oulorum]
MFVTRRTSIFLKNKRSPPAERTFFLKTIVRHPPNEHFSQKQVFATRRTNIFLKNDCSPPAERTFFSKTIVRHLLNKHLTWVYHKT